MHLNISDYMLKAKYFTEPGPGTSPEIEPDPSSPEIEPIIPPDSPLPNITL